MHLDCVFSVISDSVCIMLEEMIGEDSPTRRLVDEYSRDPITGTYSQSRRAPLRRRDSKCRKGRKYQMMRLGVSLL